MKIEKYFNWVSIIIGAIGGFLSYLFGGWDILLKTIVLLAIFDYVTGFIKGIYLKQLSSEISFRGLLKKIVMFIVIAVSYCIQTLLGGNVPLRVARSKAGIRCQLLHLNMILQLIS